MNLFQSTFYYIANKKENNQLEKPFLDFKRQLDVYEKQFSLTLKSYLKEWDNELLKLKTEYETSRKEADKVYEEVMAEVGTDDDYAPNYAMNVSGLDYLESNYAENHEIIENKYKEFLDLYSKSILVSLYALNESSLNQICKVSADLFSKKIKPSHFNSRDYLNSSIDYLELVLEIDTSILEKYISKLKDIQFIRNKIVHAGSKFSDNKIEDVVKRNEKLLHFDNDSQYLKIISSKFIKELFSLFKELYCEILWLIDEKQNSQILKNGIKYWLGLLDSNIFITQVKYERVSLNNRSINFKLSSRKKTIPKIDCRMSLKKAKEKKVEITDQTSSSVINEFMELENKSNGYHLSDVVKIFDFDNEKFELNLVIY